MSYNEILAKSRNYRRVLLTNDYKSAKANPFLFYKNTSLGCFFVDMRASKQELEKSQVIPISVWFKSDSMMERWRINRITNNEQKVLSEKGIDIDPSRILENAGYCLVCHKDMESDKDFCSKECEAIENERLEQERIKGLPICEICSKPIERWQRLAHHIKYIPKEEIVIVHKSCHNSIHKTNKYPEYTQYSPDEKESYYTKKPKSKPSKSKKESERSAKFKILRFLK